MPSRSRSQTPRPAEIDARVRVLRQFRLVFNAVRTHFRQVETSVGLSGAQLWALHMIRETPGIGMGELAFAMDIRQPTASNLVKGLATLGLVEARREGTDRRAVQLHVLDAGTRLLRRAPGPFQGVLPDALARLDASTLRALERDLGKLIAALEIDERAAGIPLAQM